MLLPRHRGAERGIIGGIIGSMAESEPSTRAPLAVFDVDGTLFRRGCCRR
jgi:hypothetical protein